MYTPVNVVTAVFLPTCLSVKNCCRTSLHGLYRKIGPVSAGLFCFLLLTGCHQTQQEKPPEQITLLFWSAMANNDLQAARQLATEDSQALLSKATGPQVEASPDLTIGEIRIQGSQATVATESLSSNQKPQQTLEFLTYLARENEQWKVDYPQTLHNMPGENIRKLTESLKKLGETFNKHLEEQVPLIEKEIDQFAGQLQQQIEQFNHDLEKSLPSKRRDPYRGSI